MFEYMSKMSVSESEDDSFAACLASVLDSWGKEVNHHRIAGLSGVAFSPALDTGEDCRAWWVEGGSDSRIGFLGEAVGFEVETVKVADEVEDWDAYDHMDDMPKERAEYLMTLMGAVKSEKAVLVPTWPTWSILTGWSENLSRIPFETVPGLGGLVERAWGPYRTGKAYILQPSQSKLSDEAANQEAVQYGLKVGEGSINMGRIQYGGALYQAFANCLDKTPFCGPCGEESWSCAVRTFRKIEGTARSATKFLDDAGFPNIAEKYQAIEQEASEFTHQKLKEEWHGEGFCAELKQHVLGLHKLHGKAVEAIKEWV